MGRRRNWIKNAIRNPGALTNWFKRNRAKLKRKLGYDPITRKGDIRDQAILGTLKLIRNGKLRVKTTTVRRLILARTLRKLRRRRRR